MLPVTGTLEVRADGGRSWARLDLHSISGTGRLNPRLLLSWIARLPVPYSKVALADVTLRLEHRQELLGEGRVVEHSLSDEAQVTFEVVTSPRLLRYITDALVPSAAAVQLEATLHGWARCSLDPGTPLAQGRPTVPGDPEPGEWTGLNVSHSYPSPLQIARSEWYERVLAPTRNEQYRYLEMALPQDDKMMAAEWARAVENLDKAERAYAAGDDPAVFLHLRGAHDALLGAKQNILDGIQDKGKRSTLDALLKQASEFLHKGRHVATDGTQEGSFPVDHLDAAFALDLIRVLLAHLSLMLGAERRRTSANTR